MVRSFTQRCTTASPMPQMTPANTRVSADVSRPLGSGQYASFDARSHLQGGLDAAQFLNQTELVARDRLETEVAVERRGVLFDGVDDDEPSGRLPVGGDGPGNGFGTRSPGPFVPLYPFIR